MRLKDKDSKMQDKLLKPGRTYHVESGGQVYQTRASVEFP